MELIIGIVVGIIIGLVVGAIIFQRRHIPVGELRIDRSDPTSEPFLFLELALITSVTAAAQRRSSHGEQQPQPVKINAAL